jgi:hypothetical protein
MIPSLCSLLVYILLVIIGHSVDSYEILYTRYQKYHICLLRTIHTINMIILRNTEVKAPRIKIKSDRSKK